MSVLFMTMLNSHLDVILDRISVVSSHIITLTNPKSNKRYKIPSFYSKLGFSVEIVSCVQIFQQCTTKLFIKATLLDHFIIMLIIFYF